MNLSSAATIVLTRAAERPDRRLEFHRKLPTGGRHKMIDALLRDGLIAEVQGDYRLGDGALLIENSATGLMLTTLALSDAGLRALNLQASGTTDTGAGDAPTAPNVAAVQAEAMAVAVVLEAAHAVPVGARARIRDAAITVLSAWDNRDSRSDALPQAILQLRAALAREPRPPTRDPGAPRKPREGTKQQAVLELLRRDEGATIAQIVAATAWARHTVRGFLANLKRKDISVEVLERVRQIGPSRMGAKGSYSIYRIAGAA